MRDFEFRAKAEYNNEWVYGLLVHYNRNPRSERWTIRDETVLGLEHDVNPETIGEFTGTVDCDYNYIYEDDIVEVVNGKKFLVIFKEGRFFAAEDLRYPFLSKGWTLTKAQTSCKVIGNKYDNPELLDKGG